MSSSKSTAKSSADVSSTTLAATTLPPQGVAAPLATPPESQLGCLLGGGHAIIDTWEYFIRSVHCPKYSLDALASHFQMAKSNQVHYSNIPALAAGDKDDRAMLAEYCLHDALTCAMLFRNAGIGHMLDDGSLGWLFEEDPMLLQVKLYPHSENLTGMPVVFQLSSPCEQDTSTFACFLCSNTGHSAKECPNRTCYNCGGSAHSYKDCPHQNICFHCKQVGHQAKV